MSIAQIEEKRKFMESYGWLSDQLKEQKEEIERLCLDAMLPKGIQYSGMPRGGDGYHDLSGYSAKLEAMIDRLQERADRLAMRLEEITDAVEGLENPQERLVLRYRYILRKEWREIAREMGYRGTKSLHNLRNDALRHLEIPGYYT